MSKSTSAGLLSDCVDIDSTSTPLSPLDGGMKNSVREIEMTELRSMASTVPGESNGHIAKVRNNAKSDETTEVSIDQYQHVGRKTNATGHGKKTYPVQKTMTSDNGIDSSLVKGQQQKPSKYKTVKETIVDVHSPSGIAETSLSTLSTSEDLDVSMPTDSGLSSLSRLSCEEEDVAEMEYYCVDHMLLLSYKNVREDHAACEYVVPAHEWAEAQTMERDRRNVEQELQKFDSFAARMIEDRNEFVQDLEEEKDLVADEFLDMMEDLIAFLLRKKKQFLQHLDTLHREQMDDINEQIKRCKKVQAETSTCLNKLSDTQVGSDQFKKLKKEIQMKCPVYEEILRRDFNNCLRVSYEFRQDPWVEQVFNQMTSLGDVVLRDSPTKLPGFLSMVHKTDLGKRNILEISHNEGSIDENEQSCSFTGATFISGGRLILVDWNNSCLKLFSNKGLLLQKLVLLNHPWDIKSYTEDRVIVSVPGEHRICTVVYGSAANDGLALESSFKIECECWGIVPIGDKLAVTSEPWSKNPSVRVYSQTGKLLSFYQKDAKGNNIFKYPEHICSDVHQQVLYVSDNRQNMVIALTVGGCVMFRYIHKLLVSPTGIAADIQGYVYVCGKDSSNVHQISRTGECVRILIDNAILQKPKAICFDSQSETLLVTDNGKENCDDFFTLKWE